MSRNPSHPSNPADVSAGPGAAPAVLRFAGVCLRYGRQPETLSDVSFALQPGSFHVLSGLSGAGKSSLLRLIYRAEVPTAGAITLFGQDLARLSRERLALLRRRIGVVFQDFRLLDHLSALDNVALPLRIAGGRPKAYKADAAELLDWVGLGSKLHAMPASLSGGEKQRLAIARAVVAQPELILADEPTGNIDQEMGHRVLRLLMELNRMGVTVLVASHDRGLAARAGAPELTLQDARLLAKAEAA